ncbi:MAG: TAXI family TRAP transporter solute-binding subunit [Rhodobacteraceae bacterium]|nr:TAXI family TRAP transporter solute-binding subunit [Paracoccaceae bacterium]MBR9821030.1 TAXI family TRAP transporter solute-binding subunit [Paracoccaceae bacterium]
MKKLYTAAACTAALSAWTVAASAQVVTLSTTNPGGLGHSIGSAVAKAVTEHSDLRMLVVPSGGATLQAVTGGEAECAVSNGHGLSYYTSGTGHFAHEDPHPGMKMVGAVLTSLVALFVQKDSDITSLEDLAGKRYPGDLNAQPDIDEYYKLYLDWAGLGREDVSIVPANSIVQAASDFAAGRSDAFLFSVGTAKVLEVDSAVGGLRALGVEDTPEARETLTRHLPGAFLTPLAAGSSAQITEDVNAMSVWILVACDESVPSETVQAITQSIHDNKQTMQESFGAFARFDPAQMAPAIEGVTYHDGAIAFYESAGMWPPKD